MILVILIQTLSARHPLSRVTDFGSESVFLLRSGEPEVDGTTDRKTVRCPSIGSCTILLQTLSSGHPLSRITDFGSGSVLPLRSGEPKADGTGDRKTVRCPSIGSCMILMETLSSGDQSLGSPISDVVLYFLCVLVNQR